MRASFPITHELTFTLGELARPLITFGAEDAIDLDGGGSATLAPRKHLLNRPYSDQDHPLPSRGR